MVKKFVGQCIAGQGDYPMPSYGDPFFELDELGKVFWQSLKELPIRKQLLLFSEIEREFDVRFRIDGGRPFVYVAPDMRLNVSSEKLNTLFHDCSEELAFGLLRHHGLDPDRIAILHYFGALGPPPPIIPAGIRVSFGPEHADMSGIGLPESALVTDLLLQLDLAFRAAFEPFTMSPVEARPGDGDLSSEAREWFLEPAYPELKLMPGSVKAILSKSIAGAGILLLLDAASGGASLPVTIPMYAQLAAGGTLFAGGAIGAFVEQRLKWFTGTKTKEEANKLAAEAKNIAAEAARKRAETSGILMREPADTEKAWAEVDKARAEAARSWAEARRTIEEALSKGIEATRALAEREMLPAREDTTLDKTRAETEEIRERTKKLRAEYDAAVMALSAGSQQTVTTPPPASAVPIQHLIKAAEHYNVRPVVATLAYNTGFPFLARAQAAGMQITRLDPAED
jgi:hypothetical protein